jgi:gas vesicle protein
VCIDKEASREVNAVLDGIGLSDEEKQAEQQRVGQQIKNVYSMWFDAVNEKQKRLAQEVTVLRRQIEDTYTALQRPYDGASVGLHHHTHNMLIVIIISDC